MNSGPKTSISTSARFTQYSISSGAYLKFNGTASAPVFRVPKYIGSHSRQFISSMPTLSPFCMPRSSKRFAKRFAFSSNIRQVISLLYGSSGSGWIRSYSFHVMRLMSFMVGLSSTKATSSPCSLAFFTSKSIIGIVSLAFLKNI